MGYPTEADTEDYFSDRGLDSQIAENDSDFIVDFRRLSWGRINFMDWVGPLGVYPASATTFKVRGGYYLWKGQAKTYTTGSAVDPTDNDTTYVWLKSDNTIASGIDGDGWPAYEHIKLAEIDVDNDGIITAVRDLRGQAFLGNWAVGLDNQAPSFILTATITAGADVNIFNADAPFKFRVLDAWSVATSADGGTWKLTNGTNDITDNVTVTGTDKTIDRIGTIDNAYHEIAASGSLVVDADGANADCEVYIQCMRVS